MLKAGMRLTKAGVSALANRMVGVKKEQKQQCLTTGYWLNPF